MKKRKLKKGIPILLTLMIFFIALFIYSITNIIIWYISNNKNNSIKEELNESVEIIKTDETETYKIDFKNLKEKNKDTVAYLKVNNTNIDYIVVKGNDNEYYLKHNFNKEWNIAGWIFADYHNLFNGLDKNIVIYGHNTRNGSMFGSLHNVLNESWYKNQDNMNIHLITESDDSYYQIFSIYTIEREAYYINTEFNNDTEFSEFINTIKKRSIYDFDIKVSGSDQILTLSTCTTGGINRVVVHAKKVLT